MKPFTLAYLPEEAFDPDTYIREYGCMKEDADRLVQEQRETVVYINGDYQVNVRRIPAMGIVGWPAMVHLSIKRVDREPIHDWRALQQIKNMIAGEENEAMELYPAESRLVDTANQYHLWVFADSSIRFPVGWGDRMVFDGSINNSKQRPFSEV